VTDRTAGDLDEVEGDLEDLLGFIRDARGFDFTGYKRSSLTRRIRKRMADIGVPGYLDYRDRLETDAEEFRYLFNTILINVTSFFRDADAWTFLRREVLPDLLRRTRPDADIRVWSAGCSSGEEAYSLAILFAEVLGIAECAERVKIYGTDVDEEALRDARSGLYSARSLEALAPEIRDKYFEPHGALFGFRSDLRRRVIFGRHDITRDAPISRLDLLVCRNTLMYFNVETQVQIMDRFHFALVNGGHLFLGKAEMLLSDGDRFEVVGIRQRIFRRRPGEAGAVQPATPMRLDPQAGPVVRDASRRRQVRELVTETSPTAALAVDQDGNVVLINAAARVLFGLTAHDVGRPLRDLEVSYRPVELRSLIEQAYAERRPIRVNSIERRTVGDEPQFLDICVQPLSGVDGVVAGVAVSFLDTTLSTRLQQEVKRIREDLETAYEELQSTNEELETTNEELQSGNEELETMNEELRTRTTELDDTRTFLEGVLSSVAAGVIVLDANLRVFNWNRGAEELWGLRTAEVRGQAFFDLDFGLPTAGLREIVEECLVSGRRSEPIEISAVNRIGRPIVCSVACSALDGRRTGVVLLMEEAHT
jgi:two-component system CheB/CheR fusion protein